MNGVKTNMDPMNCNKVLFGQVISLLIACSGVVTKYLERKDASIPAFQSFCSYCLFGTIFMIYRIRSYPAPFYVTTTPIRMYLAIAMIDVQANFLVLSAFRYANFASVALLLHLTIPFVTIISYYALHKRYFWKHYVGSLVAFLGSVVLFISDFDPSNSSNTTSEVKGNLMCVLAAILYSVSNVVQEYCVSKGGMEASAEFLSFLGVFAAIFTGFQVGVLESYEMSHLHWEAPVILLFIAYAVDIVAFYTLVSIFLQIAESLFFNLSLLTADIFTILASYCLFDQPVSGTYWIALALNMLGIVVYSIDKPQDVEDENELETEDEKVRYSMVSTPSPSGDKFSEKRSSVISMTTP